jgi:hypothetical protein
MTTPREAASSTFFKTYWQSPLHNVKIQHRRIQKQLQTWDAWITIKSVVNEANVLKKDKDN